MNWIIGKPQNYWKRQQLEAEIRKEIKKEAGGITPSKLRTELMTKRGEVELSLTQNKAKVANATAINNKTGWEAWESEDGIKVFIQHLEKELTFLKKITPDS